MIWETEKETAAEYCHSHQNVFMAKLSRYAPPRAFPAA
jgi:hypothetical protein